MYIFKPQHAIEISSHSGQMRVDIHPRPALIPSLLEVAGIAVLVFFLVQNWSSLAVWLRALLTWGLVSAALAVMYQFGGSEILEFDAQKLSISRGLSLFSRRIEYPVSGCTELQGREQTDEDDNWGLQCKYGWRTVKFGRYVSEKEADEILAALQGFLPDVARQMCSSPETKKHFTTLDLH